MNAGDLSFAEFDRALRSAGLVMAFGPFAVRLKVREPALARALHQLYADYPLADTDRVAQFCEVAVLSERHWRGGFRRGFAIYSDRQLHGRSLDLPIALPSLEWTINWIVATTAHRYVMIHAAAVERDGLALLMPGDPGSGKSTLCAALIGRGWRLLSDEFGLLRPEDGLLVPMPRPISLKNQSIELIRGATPGMRFSAVIGGTPKGNVTLAAPPPVDIRRQHEPARPRWIVFPAWRQDQAAPTLQPLTATEAFVEINDNAINYEIAGEAGFRAVRGLAETCAAYRLSFGSLEQGLQAIDSLEAEAAPRPAAIADAS